MSDLVAAFSAETARVAGAETALVSITFDVVSDKPADEWTKTEIKVERATKSLVFSVADVRNSAGVRLMSANAVHKVVR